MAKALAVSEAIGRLSSDERQSKPSVAFGNDYNRMLHLAEKSYSDFGVYLPPAVNTHGRDTEEGYGEIMIGAAQIYAMLKALDGASDV